MCNARIVGRSGCPLADFPVVRRRYRCPSLPEIEYYRYGGRTIGRAHGDLHIYTCSLWSTMRLPDRADVPKVAVLRASDSGKGCVGSCGLSVRCRWRKACPKFLQRHDLDSATQLYDTDNSSESVLRWHRRRLWRHARFPVGRWRAMPDIPDLGRL